MTFKINGKLPVFNLSYLWK